MAAADDLENLSSYKKDNTDNSSESFDIPENDTAAEAPQAEDTPDEASAEELPPEPSKQSQPLGALFESKMATLIIIVAAVGVLSVVTYFSRRQTPAEPVITPTPAFTPEAALLPDPTADWQTYRNEEYDFEIKLPPEFTESTERLRFYSDSELVQEKITRQAGYEHNVSSGSAGIIHSVKIDIYAFNKPLAEHFFLIDSSNGTTFAYDSSSKSWSYVQGLNTDTSPEKLAHASDVYRMESGDGTNSWEQIIIPHASQNAYIEIIIWQTVQELSSYQFQSDVMVSSFNFISSADSGQASELVACSKTVTTDEELEQAAQQVMEEMTVEGKTDFFNDEDQFTELINRVEELLGCKLEENALKQ